MGKKKSVRILGNVLSIIFISLTGLTGVIFTVMYLETFNNGFIADYFGVILAVSVTGITVVTMLTIMLSRRSGGVMYKLCLITVVLISVCVLALYFLKVSGFLNKIDSVEALRKYVESYGKNAVWIFIVLQFLQVVVLPIPAVITVAAGVLLFGAFKSAVYSCIGIIAGSLVAFFIGKVFGYKVAKWLVGKENLDKWLNVIKGKDKIILTFMFLFPFFPDDVLCFVAGITTMSPLFFIIMIFITRIISVFASCYSINGSIIPFNTWWGLVLWGIFVAVTVVLAVLIYKKGDKIEHWFKTRKNIAKKQKNTDKTL